MPDVRQLLHDAGDAQPVTDLDLDALVGRAGTRRRRRQALRMGAAAAAVLAAVGGLLAVTRGLGDDDALPPSGGDDVRTVSPDAEAFLLEYLTGPYIPNGFLVVAPAASVGLEPELIATGTIEDVQPRGVPADGCDAACPPHWYLDISLRIDRAVHGSVAPGTTITLPVEMLTTPNDPEAVDPPTPAEAASDLVETAPIGQRAVVFARHPRDETTGWELVNPASIAIEDGGGRIRTLNPRTGSIERTWTWDEYMAEIDHWLGDGALPRGNPPPGVPDTVVADVEDP